MDKENFAKSKQRGRPPSFRPYPKQKRDEPDPCDCQYAKCPGCWYPCETCGSNKCSHFCRVSRKQPIEWQISD